MEIYASIGVVLMNTLPQDVLIEILSFVPVNDRYHIKRQDPTHQVYPKHFSKQFKSHSCGMISHCPDR
jgi:hypothetical protein